MQNSNCHIPSCHREHTHKPRPTNLSGTLGLKADDCIYPPHHLQDLLE